MIGIKEKNTFVQISTFNFMSLSRFNALAAIENRLDPIHWSFGNNVKAAIEEAAARGFASVGRMASSSHLIFHEFYRRQLLPIYFGTEPSIQSKPKVFEFRRPSRRTDIPQDLIIQIHHIKKEAIHTDDFSKYEFILDPPVEWEKEVFYTSRLKTKHRFKLIDFDQTIQYFLNWTIDEQAQVLKEISKTLRRIKNTLNALIARFTYSTETGLYQLEPLIRATFHYIVKISAIEKVNGLLQVFNPIRNSSIFLQWLTQPYPKLLPPSRR